MGGETDLAQMLATLTVSRRPGVYVFVSLDEVPPGITAEATIVEAEGTTLVLRAEDAAAAGWAWTFEAAWLTLDVHSALDAVGLTAAVAAALAEHGIPCNVLAGAFHDHLLVPVDRADAASAAIMDLRNR